MLARIMQTSATGWVLLIRILVGCVFVSEGIQKFIRAEEVGIGRFERIGIPAPDLTAPLTGTFEVICGLLVLVGLLTRLAVIPLLIVMGVAIAMTTWPQFQREGFWPTAHDARNDWAMVWGSLFLLIVGAGRWSLDRFLAQRRTSSEE